MLEGMLENSTSCLRHLSWYDLNYGLSMKQWLESKNMYIYINTIMLNLSILLVCTLGSVMFHFF